MRIPADFRKEVASGLFEETQKSHSYVHLATTLVSVIKPRNSANVAGGSMSDHRERLRNEYTNPSHDGAKSARLLHAMP